MKLILVSARKAERYHIQPIEGSVQTKTLCNRVLKNIDERFMVDFSELQNVAVCPVCVQRFINY